MTEIGHNMLNMLLVVQIHAQANFTLMGRFEPILDILAKPPLRPGCQHPAFQFAKHLISFPDGFLLRLTVHFFPLAGLYRDDGDPATTGFVIVDRSLLVSTSRLLSGHCYNLLCNAVLPL